MVVAALALTTPPLVFFIIYFCLLHSARHLREGFDEERGVLPQRVEVGIVIGATVAPIVAAAAFLSFTGGGAELDERLLQVAFIGLAALTVPHMIVVTLGDRSRAHSDEPNELPVATEPKNDETAPIRP